MIKLMVLGVAILLAAVAVDRLLLWMEARGWIYWRRNRPARGASTYHMLELHSNFDPGIQHILEATVKEEEDEDDSGDPPLPDRRPATDIGTDGSSGQRRQR